MYEISVWMMGICLLFCSLCDWKKGGVRTWLLLGMTVATLGYVIGCSGESIRSILFGGLLGGVFLLVSFCSKEEFGYADSWMLSILGLFLGGKKVLLLAVLAFFAAGLWALCGMIFRHWNRKKTIPFIPFLFLGYMGVML